MIIEVDIPSWELGTVHQDNHPGRRSQGRDRRGVEEEREGRALAVSKPHNETRGNCAKSNQDCWGIYLVHVGFKLS